MLLTSRTWYAARNEARRLLVGAVEDQGGWTLTKPWVTPGGYTYSTGRRLLLSHNGHAWSLGASVGLAIRIPPRP